MRKGPAVPTGSLPSLSIDGLEVGPGAALLPHPQPGEVEKMTAHVRHDPRIL